jgi:hypothetical protein
MNTLPYAKCDEAPPGLDVLNMREIERAVDAGAKRFWAKRGRSGMERSEWGSGKRRKSK